MTLATAILLFANCFASVDPGVVGQSMPQSDSAGSAPTSVQQAPSNPTASESTKPSSGKPASQTPAKKPKVSTAKKTGQTKKVAPAVTTTCDPPPTNGSSAGSNPEPAPPPASTQEPSTPEAQKNCPPSPHQKKIVQQGGITEQSIQLAGGSDDEATKKRGDANRLLATTQDNLKKLSGRQLSSAEESSVSQIVQFVDQSKTAASDGDLERAYTLALKAQLLSDDLVNPRK
jgi:hypothetical protein